MCVCKTIVPNVEETPEDPPGCEASEPLLLEQRPVFPWAIMPSKYNAHRRVRSAINCYAIRGGREAGSKEREKGDRE